MNLWFDATMFFEMQYGCENFSRSKRFLSLSTQDFTLRSV